MPTVILLLEVRESPSFNTHFFLSNMNILDRSIVPFNGTQTAINSPSHRGLENYGNDRELHTP